MESKLQRSPEVENPKDLATCNRLLLDQQRLEDQLDNRRQELNDIQKDAGSNMQDRIDAVFYRTYPLLHHKFENILIFLYSFCSPGNQDYQKIIYFLIFSSKRSKSIMQKLYCYWN